MEQLGHADIASELEHLSDYTTRELISSLLAVYVSALAGHIEERDILIEKSETLPVAKYLLARYFLDLSPACNAARIECLLAEASAAGIPAATLWLAHAKEIGLLPARENEVPALYEKAARAQYLPAIDYFAHALYAGNFGENRKKEGLKWMTHAAKAGCVGAARTLGLAYLCGETIPSDLGAARKWLDHASRQGDEFAEVLLLSDPRLR